MIINLILKKIRKFRVCAVQLIAENGWIKINILFVVLVLFFHFFFCAVMSILSFKLDFYMFALSIDIYIYKYIYKCIHICIHIHVYFSSTIFYLVSTVVPFFIKHCTFCRELYKYIYARLSLLKNKANTGNFVVVDVVILYSSVLPAIIYYYWVLFVSLHIFVM